MKANIFRQLLRLLGADLKRYDKSLGEYARLYERYRDFTMIPREHFILNLELIQAYSHITGTFVECGVWRGGMSAATAEVLGGNRRLHLFDSFEGLPPAKPIDGSEAVAWQQDTQSPGYYDNCTADEHFAIDAMRRAHHDNYQLHKGWFDQTTRNSLQQPIAILRLDGDWYDSILVCLENLFPLVTEGGIVILDDYFTWDGCAKAVHDYLSREKSLSRIYQWHDRIGYIIKKNA